MQNENNLLQLNVPNKLESLTVISKFLNKNMKSLGIGIDKIAEVQIAVDEAFTNMIQYSEAKNSKKNIEINCKRSNGHFRIELKNYGNPFNPITTKIAPDLTSNLDERFIGGLGIHFIKNLIDDLRYEYSELGGYEILTMIKYV